MPRILNPEAHALRRDSFVDAAQRLIQTKGYEQMSIQDVLDELEASKGSFYHYFGSKESLLEAVLERMTDAVSASLALVAADPDLPAAAKLGRFFSTLAQWKGERTELMVELLRVWASSDNSVVREQLRRGVTSRLTPLLTRIVRQGMDEGVFSASSAEGAAAVLVSLLLGANETATRLFLARQAGAVSFEDVECTFGAYSEAFERILGLAAGSLRIADEATIRFWYD